MDRRTAGHSNWGSGRGFSTAVRVRRTPILEGMKTVAIIGASPDRRKFGNKALRAFRTAGYNTIPINPNHAEVEGERTYATVLDYPGTIDMATVYVPPEIGERVIEGIAQKG